MLTNLLCCANLIHGTPPVRRAQSEQRAPRRICARPQSTNRTTSCRQGCAQRPMRKLTWNTARGEHRRKGGSCCSSSFALLGVCMCNSTASELRVLPQRLNPQPQRGLRLPILRTSFRASQVAVHAYGHGEVVLAHKVDDVINFRVFHLPFPFVRAYLPW